jgi:hypothetical protein
MAARLDSIKADRQSNSRTRLRPFWRPPGLTAHPQEGGRTSHSRAVHTRRTHSAHKAPTRRPRAAINQAPGENLAHPSITRGTQVRAPCALTHCVGAAIKSATPPLNWRHGARSGSKAAGRTGRRARRYNTAVTSARRRDERAPPLETTRAR